MRFCLIAILMLATLAGRGKTLFIAGDSTLHKRAATSPFGSWGDALAPYLRADVPIDNRAWSGYSTQSFIAGGRWPALIESVKPGDFVLIQFGHNDLDQSRKAVYAPADGLYKENLRKMVRDVRTKQATPIFATSIAQRTFENGKLVDTLGLNAWVAAMKAVAAELAVECVDMNALTREKILSVDEATSLTWFFASHDGKDFTHPTKAGAGQFAPLFVNAVRSNRFSIGKLFAPPKPTRAESKKNMSPKADPAACTEAAREVVERFLDDPHRPKFHFVIDGNGMPGDPNGAFWHRGRYHLMYLYKRPRGFCWGHSSSADLLHWRRHADAIGVGPNDSGAYSGGGFVDDDGTAYLSYWMLWGARGLGLVRSQDPAFESWEKLPENPVVKSTHWGWTLVKDAAGREVRYASADPSNIWKKGGKYYMLAGNLCLLNDNGRKADSPEELKGDGVSLFESADLKTWSYRHPFYRRRTAETRASGWTDPDEDNMCPVFLPLPRADGRPSGKHLLLFISHNRGCQYYIGSYDTSGDRFVPESHGRMTWRDKTYFAPEALIDGKGRLIVWTWLLDNRKGAYAHCGWTGVYGLPRSVYLTAEGELGIVPVEELKTLRLNGCTWDAAQLAAGKSKSLTGFPGAQCELELVLDAASAANFALKVRRSPDGCAETVLSYDAQAKELVFDGTHSGDLDIEEFCGHVPVERAPLALKPGEDLKLNVYVDGPVVEVFANDRQAICRRVYPSQAPSEDVEISAVGGPVAFKALRAWEIAPTNPY